MEDWTDPSQGEAYLESKSATKGCILFVDDDGYECHFDSKQSAKVRGVALQHMFDVLEGIIGNWSSSFHCEATQNLWSAFFALCGICWVMLGYVNALLHAWSGVKVSKDWRKRWELMPHSIWWTIWKKRNMRYFEGMRRSLSHLTHEWPFPKPFGYKWCFRSRLWVLWLLGGEFSLGA